MISVLLLIVLMCLCGLVFCGCLLSVVYCCGLGVVNSVVLILLLHSVI